MYEKFGQLANRLFLFSHFLANALENNYRLTNLCFTEFDQYFEWNASEKTRALVTHKISPNSFLNKFSSLLLRVLFKVVGLLVKSSAVHRVVSIKENYDKKGVNFKLADPGWIEAVKGAKFTLVKGWGFRDNASFIKHAAEIRNCFTPLAAYRSKPDNLVSQLRQGYDVLIGVHIRRGDYFDFQGGCFYYSDHEYLAYMKQVRDLVPLKKTAFIICSDEAVVFEEKDLNIFKGPGHFIEDLYILSRMDYIIGPPSTFSMWASFYGQVPLGILHEKEGFLPLDTFRVVEN